MYIFCDSMQWFTASNSQTMGSAEAEAYTGIWEPFFTSFQTSPGCFSDKALPSLSCWVFRQGENKPNNLYERFGYDSGSCQWLAHFFRYQSGLLDSSRWLELCSVANFCEFLCTPALVCHCLKPYTFVVYNNCQTWQDWLIICQKWQFLLTPNLPKLDSEHACSFSSPRIPTFQQ